MRAQARLGGAGRLYTEPLYEPLRSDMAQVLDGLHPVAKRVMARVHGIWPVDHLPDAAAVFLPCDIDEREGRGGFILIDANEYPVDSVLRDAHVPVLYWRALAGLEWPAAAARLPVSLAPGASRPSEHPAMRYLVIHELGHALSLYAREFDLSAAGRFRVGRTDGFVRFSWRLTSAGGPAAQIADRGTDARGIAPRVSLSLREWESLRSALDDDPALPSAGLFWRFARRAPARARRVCAAARKLGRAGFVTPTAALYPTEDFAETFAHAILADEGTIARDDRMRLDLPHCSVTTIRSPYFSPWLSAKRQYMERALGLPRQR